MEVSKGLKKSRLYVVSDESTTKMNGMQRNDDVALCMSFMASPASKLVDIFKVSTRKVFSPFVCDVCFFTA